MAKSLKRAGIIFFAIFVACLVALGCVLSANVSTTNNDDFSMNFINREIADNNSNEEFEAEFTLTGDLNLNETVWNQAVQTSISESREVKVIMTGNWTAVVKDTVAVFGHSDSEYVKEEIIVPEGANIVLNLNGQTINRALTKNTKNGSVLRVLGELTICDSKFDFEEAKYVFDITPDGMKTLLKAGKITGGNTSTDGGGIYCDMGSKLNIYGGILVDNFANGYGGGIFGNKGSIINFYNGLVIENTTKASGGGVCVLGGTLNVHNGIFYDNEAVTNGGGISLNRHAGTENTTSNFTMYDGIIANNYSKLYGGGIGLFDTNAEIFGGQIINNQADTNSAGVTIWHYGSELTAVKIHGGLIAKNLLNYTASNTDNGGAGILLGAKCTLEMDGGEISENYLVSNNNYVKNGAGILVNLGGHLILKGGVIKNNVIKDYKDKISAGAGIAIRDDDCKITISGNPQVYGNVCNDEDSDLYLSKNVTAEVGEFTNGDIQAKMGIQLAEDYVSKVFTNKYSENNNFKPYKYFFSNQDMQIAILQNGEVTFEKTLSTSVYDFKYLDNDIRKSYKLNDIIHGKNDFDIILNQKDKVVIGNILYNTSINTFIDNIGFERTNVKLYNSSGKLIYDRGGNVEGIDSAYYDKRFELPVGSGWKVETYTNDGAKIEEIYLSVLGDCNGDGRLMASDMIYLRELAANKELFDKLSVEVKLACLLDNKGYLTTIDSEIVNNIISHKVSIDRYL